MNDYLRGGIVMHRFLTLSVILLFACTQTYANAAVVTGDKRVTVGYVEYVAIPKLDTKLKAKMDTGAETSSIHANIIELKKRKKGEEDSGYVIFTVETHEGSSNLIKKPITRFVKIKLKTGGFQRRPVVEMAFCIAGVLVRDEVNLADREDFIYDVLVGRNMLIKGGLVVDAGKALSIKPNCVEPKEEGTAPTARR
jgi:hypothetical protein